MTLRLAGTRAMVEARPPICGQPRYGARLWIASGPERGGHR